MSSALFRRAPRLYRHQADALAWLRGRPRATVALDVGMGKTLVAIEWLVEHRTPGRPSLVLVPSHLIPQWRKNLAEFTPELSVADCREPWLKAPNASNQKKFAATFAASGPDIFLLSHDFVRSRIEHYRLFDWDLLVVDEAAELKGGGVNHAAAVQLSRTARRALLLTASLHENSILDIRNLLRLMDPDGLPFSDEEFDKRFVRWKRGYNLWEWVPDGIKPENLPELKPHLQQRIFLLSAAEAGIPMPTLVNEHWTAPLTSVQKAEYRRAQHNGPGGYIKRSIIAAHSNGESGMANMAVQFIAEQPPSRKMLVRAEHLDHLDIVARLLDERGIGHVRIDGGKKHGERADAVAALRNDPNVRALLGTRALERGLDGCQVADLMISLMSSFNPAREQQAAGRICRIGSPHDTVFHVTITPDVSVGAHRNQIVAGKRAEAEMLFDDWTNEPAEPAA